MSAISDHEVYDLAVDCSVEDDDVIQAGGIVHSLKFGRAGIEAHHERIKALLDQLPKEFHAQTGGGWTFLNACMDRSGRQWTDLHATMETLFCLGAAAGYVTCLMPRDMWDALPGGVPYLMVRAERGEPGVIE